MGRRPLLSPCQGVLDAPACSAAPTGPLLFWAHSMPAKAGRAPLTFFLWAAHAWPCHRLLSPPHPPPTVCFEEGPLCSLHLFSAVAAAKAVGASRDARPTRRVGPRPCGPSLLPSVLQGDTRRTRAGASRPPRDRRASRARRRHRGGGVAYAGGVARRCAVAPGHRWSGRVRHATSARGVPTPPTRLSGYEKGGRPFHPVAVARWWGPVCLRLCCPLSHTLRRGRLK